MLDKLIIMSVNTTSKSDMCVMYHSVKRCGVECGSRGKVVQNFFCTPNFGRPQKFFGHL